MANKTPILVILHGTSGSGKTSPMNYMRNVYDWDVVHPIQDLKNFLEDHYCCPDLNSDEGKMYRPSNVNFENMQDLMVKYWQFFKEYDPNFSGRYFGPELETYYDEGRNVIINAIRNFAEIDILVNCSYKRKLWVNVTRPNKDRPEVSDINWAAIKKKAKESKAFHIVNATNDFQTVEEWNNYVADLISEFTVLHS